MKAKELVKNPKIKKLWIKCGSILIALFVLLIGLVVVTLVLNNNYKVAYHYESEYAVEVDNPTKCKKNKTYELLSPTRVGYEFLGWTDLGGNFFTELSGIKADQIDLYACWSEPYFIVDNGVIKSTSSLLKTKEIVEIPETFEGIEIKGIASNAFSYDAALKEITIPKSVTEIKENAFIGCTNLKKIKYLGTTSECSSSLESLDSVFNYLDIECTNGTIDGTNKIKTMYTIHFETFGGSTIEDVQVERKHKLERPQDPVKDKYLFKGWFKNEACTQAYNFNDEVMNGFTLYAKYELDPDQIEKEYVTVIFETNGGSHINDMEAEKNKPLTLPADPTRDNFSFNGWFYDNEFKNPFEPTKPVEIGMYLYAKWGPIVYEPVLVKFVTSGGSQIPDTYTGTNGKVERPEDPVRGTDVFKGWFKEPTYQTPFDFDKPLTEETTIYAKFEGLVISKVTIKFIDIVGENEVELGSLTINEGSVINSQDLLIPTKDGITFYDWYYDKEFNNQYLLTDNINEDTKLYARFEHLLGFVYDEAGTVTGKNNTYYIESIGTINSNNITIPSQFKGKDVIAIKQDAFKNSTVSTVVIEDGVELICQDAFAGSSLQSITLPNSIKRIESGAFKSCSLLQKVVLNEGLAQVEIDLFKDSGITEVVLPSTVIKLNDNSIPNGTKLYVKFSNYEEFSSHVEVDVTIDLSTMTIYYYRDDLTGLSGNYWSFDGSGNIITA